MARRPEVRDRMFSRMNRVSQIPISSLEAQEKAHPEVGIGGIMIANTLARHAKVSVEQIYVEHKTGKSWGEMANDHRVNTADLIEKVADYEASGRDAEHDARARLSDAHPAAEAPIIVRARVPEHPTAPVVRPVPPVIPELPKAPTAPRVPVVDVAVVTAKPEPLPSSAGRTLDKDALERRARLNQHIDELDAMGRRPEVRDRMLSRMYRLSQIPISSLEAQEKSHPEAGIGGIMIANTLARHAKMPVEQIYAEHKAGKSWGELANEHRVNTADLLEKVSDYKASARDAEHDAAVRAK